MALVHAGLGEKDQAFAELEQGFRERARAMPFLQVEPMMDDLRSDQRFTELLRRIGLTAPP